MHWGWGTKSGIDLLERCGYRGDFISGRFIPDLVINIPVSIDNLPYEFNMQFDLGAVTSVLYGNSIKPYLKLHSNLRNKIDSTRTFISNLKRM